MDLGLRVDVDTWRGTRTGVPGLCKILSDHAVAASFFFSVGPDNMGRHLWRLFKPAFLKKMLRSNAPGLYGWDILLRGTFWPGPVIGEKAGDIIRAVAADGHEIGLHAWDHHRWQTHILHLSAEQIYQELLKGYKQIEKITGAPPTCSAAPGWICNNTILKQKESFPFIYNSDCRGKDIFRPVIDGTPLSCPQVPVTLPTYDELIGRNGITNDTYNAHLLSLIRPGKLNALTIHAEVEGIIRRDLFDDFLKQCRDRGISVQPLGRLLKNRERIPGASIHLEEIDGREGPLAIQDESDGRGETKLAS
jgi:undecaprenyl phosphate-alpha-L-ara4FN deformylase